MPKIALLANPESGSGDAGRAAAVLAELGADVEEFRLDDMDEALAGSPGEVATRVIRREL